VSSFSITRCAEPVEGVLWQVIDTGERVASVVLLTALSPVLIFSAAALAISSRRSPMIAHRRVGWGGEELWMLKLRTMWGPADQSRSSSWVEYVDQEPDYLQKDPADLRVGNWFARFCRRHSIDEIPQLWHVICGDMALIGPRPMTPNEIRVHYGSDANEVLRVKPGIAGLWQTSGRNRLTYPERRAMDLRFVRKRTLRMYLRIALRTIPEIWSGANSW